MTRQAQPTLCRSTGFDRPQPPIYRSRGLWLACVAVIAVAPTIPTMAATPAQFIAKIYTEALGRTPEQGAWQSSLNAFGGSCSQPLLKSFGRGPYLSAEYSGLGYDNTARLLTLYRGVLNREPDASGFSFWLNQLNSGNSWSAIVDTFFDSSEFASLVSSICNAESYFFDDAPVLDVPLGGSGFSGTQAQLQAVLNSTPSGGTVALAPRAVVRLTSPLVVPAGRTLTTTGSPPPNRYANMGRLVRVSNFNAEMVKVQAGGKLKHVWVAGQRGVLGYNAASIGVQTYGGSGTTVEFTRLSDATGGTNLKALGKGQGVTCTSTLLRNNLITAYASGHYPVGGQARWSDGLTIACENTTVENNQVVDATDVGIIVFDAHPAIQKSLVRFNTVLAAGNSAYGGLVADSWIGSSGVLRDFTGTSFENNTVWSGRGHFDIVLSAGTRAWFGTQSNTGTGAAFVNNTSGTLTTLADSGIAVSGMLNAFIQGNGFNSTLVNVSACPTLQVGASVSAGYASGTIQPYTDALYSGCIGH